MTGLLTSAAAGPQPALSHRFFVTALIIFLPVAAWWWHRLGDLVPLAIGLAAAAAVIWFVPKIPRSPLACLSSPGGHCGAAQGPWILGLVIVFPLTLVVLYKAIRGDKRGVKGRRLP
jgi:hypothetical protein